MINLYWLISVFANQFCFFVLLQMLRRGGKAVAEQWQAAAGVERWGWQAYDFSKAVWEPSDDGVIERL